MSAVAYTIRRSARRRARILVDGDGVEVVVPARFPLQEVEGFVEEKRPWIERTLRRMRESESDFPPARLEDGGELPYLGERLTLRVRNERGRLRPYVARRGDRLEVKLPPGGDLGARWKHGCAARRDRDRRAPRRRRRPGGHQLRQPADPRPAHPLGELLHQWGDELQLALAARAAEIVDYVVEHEVAHLEIHDHSERFWALLASRSPRWREHEAGCGGTGIS